MQSMFAPIAYLTFLRSGRPGHRHFSLPQSSSASTVCPAPNRAKRHFLDRRNIPRVNPETGVDGSNCSGLAGNLGARCRDIRELLDAVADGTASIAGGNSAGAITVISDRKRT